VSNNNLATASQWYNPVSFFRLNLFVSGTSSCWNLSDVYDFKWEGSGFESRYNAINIFPIFSYSKWHIQILFRWLKKFTYLPKPIMKPPWIKVLGTEPRITVIYLVQTELHMIPDLLREVFIIIIILSTKDLIVNLHEAHN